MMRFSRLCLLSTKEGRAFEIRFGSNVTVVRGENGHGKSAILKSLYDVLGAQPHKIDKHWQSARVATLLEFSISDRQFTAIKTGKRYLIVDRDDGKTIIDTSHVTSVLGPFWAEQLNFGLLMNDRDDELVTPPPSYAFAPFYVDQDGGWTKPWDSFQDFYLPKSRPALSDYHTGKRTNAYYIALAAKDRQQKVIKKLHDEREPFARAIEEIRKLTENLAIDLDISSFSSEINRLAEKTALLNRMQAEYREKINNLNSDRIVWSDQHHILTRALREMDETIVLAAEQPDEVDCPTCGQSYDNSIGSRFGLISEYDDIFDAIQLGAEKIKDIDEKLTSLRHDLAEIEAEIAEIDQILSIRRNDISLGDIISAQGRTETTGIIREKIATIDAKLGEAHALVAEAEKARKAAMDPKRSTTINDFIIHEQASFSRKLDVKHNPNIGKRSIKIARGSEGVREILSYYYAVLHSTRNFSSSTYCPIVIDAPNQQGQDKKHLKMIYQFLIDYRPKDAQVIFSAEEVDIEASPEIKVVDVGVQKDQLLSDDDYSRVFHEMRPYLDILI